MLILQNRLEMKRNFILSDTIRRNKLNIYITLSFLNPKIQSYLNDKSQCTEVQELITYVFTK